MQEYQNKGLADWATQNLLKTRELSMGKKHRATHKLLKNGGKSLRETL
jgi:hypothetical protein